MLAGPTVSLPPRYRGDGAHGPAAGGCGTLFRMPATEHLEALPDPNRSPVFILTASRSGSTLLRFILDSHPDFACPPETGLGSTCSQLAGTLGILDGVGSRQLHVTAGAPPEGILVAVRAVIDDAFGHYLQHRGKRRWCDKSLDSYQFADLLAELYPEAKFLCLYRHCMDVIASGVETCPWGLHRYGFDQFVAMNPGNSVAAIGSYWLSCVQEIMAFEEKNPGSCHRVRYEDLVTAPEETAAAIFSFLGAEQARGIADACFRSPHDSQGPGDEKIWFTSEVSPASIGRGVSVPVGALHPPLREAMNQALANLGYRPVDDQWNARLGPVDPRNLPVVTGSANGHPGPEDQELAGVIEAIRARMASCDAASLMIKDRWPAAAGSLVDLVVQSETGGHRALRVTFMPTAAEAGPSAAEVTAAKDGGTEPTALIIAAPDTWHALLARQANLVAEIVSGRVRCVNKRDAYRLRTDELHAVAEMLGLAQIPLGRDAATTAPGLPHAGDPELSGAPAV
jgi:protein-tyrosine sulfotransferase